MKLFVVLMIWLGLMYSETVSQLYTNSIQSENILLKAINGKRHTCFNEQDSRILFAKLKMFSAMFMPPEDCVYSNMHNETDNLRKSLYGASNSLKQANNELFIWRIIGGVGVLVTGTILIVK